MQDNTNTPPLSDVIAAAFLTLTRRWWIEMSLCCSIGLIYYEGERKIGSHLAGVGLLVFLAVLFASSAFRRGLRSLLRLTSQRRRFEIALLAQDSPMAKKRPTVIRADHRPGGIRLTVKLRSGTSFAELSRLGPYLAVHFRAREVRIEPDANDASHAYATILTIDPFGAGPIEWPGVHHQANSAWRAIPLGVDEEGNEVSVVLHERNLLIGGEPGSGKSVALSVVLASLVQDPTVELYLFDGKEVELRAWEPLAAGFAGADLPTALALLDKLIVTMQSRYAAMATKGLRKLECHHGMGLVVVVIDELPFYVANSDTKASKDFAAKLRDLIARGRAAGIVLILAAQKPSADTVPSAIRDLINLRLAFRCSTREASDTILGAGWATQSFSATNIGIGDRGVGLFLGEDGIPKRIRCYWLTDDVIFAVVAFARSHRNPNTEGEL